MNLTGDFFNHFCFVEDRLREKEKEDQNQFFTPCCIVFFATKKGKKKEEHRKLSIFHKPI